MARNKLTKTILALDIGGTFIKYAVIDNAFNFYKKGKIKNLMSQDVTKFTKSLQLLCDEYNAEYQINGVAISCLGVIKNNKEILWAGQNSIDYTTLNFSDIFKNLPFYLENDVNCAIIGEKKFGCLKNIDNAFMITLGTGIGGGIIIDHKLYKGNSGYAGEVGSIIVNGRRWEEIASVTALTIKSKEILKKEIDMAEIFDLALENNNIANYLDNWYENIASGILDICYVLNPAKFVIGGGITANKKFNLSKIKDYTKAKIFNKNVEFIVDTTIEIAKLRNDAALYGVASLYFDSENKQ